VHVDDVDCVVESDRSAFVLPPSEASAADQAIAHHIEGLISDGATLQFGIGAIPNSVAQILADGSKGDFGIHTEMFVDGIMQAAAPDPRERREIERQIARDQPIEDALAAASAALSGLSQAAGVVLAPKRELTLRQLNFVPLSSRRALAVLVGSDGSVENRIVTLDEGTTAAALSEVSNFINARLAGLTLADRDAANLREADANMALIPESVSDEAAVYCCDMLSTGFLGAENGNVPIGGTVAVFAEGPVGLMATVAPSCAAQA
jgi:hypothetical protein